VLLLIVGAIIFVVIRNRQQDKIPHFPVVERQANPMYGGGGEDGGGAGGGGIGGIYLEVPQGRGGGGGGGYLEVVQAGGVDGDDPAPSPIYVAADGNRHQVLTLGRGAEMDPAYSGYASPNEMHANGVAAAAAVAAAAGTGTRADSNNQYNMIAPRRGNNNNAGAGAGSNTTVYVMDGNAQYAVPGARTNSSSTLYAIPMEDDTPPQPANTQMYATPLEDDAINAGPNYGHVQPPEPGKNTTYDKRGNTNLADTNV
jgi:hypothetical protein